MGTTDLPLYPNALYSNVSFGAIFGFTFGTLVLSKVQKHQLTDFTEEKCLIYYRGFFKSHNLPKNLRVTLILVLGRVQWGNDSPTSKGSGTTDLPFICNTTPG